MADNGNDSQVPRNCASCSRPDEHDDMVACDACHNWHHYSCVQVDAMVQDQAWKCASCELPTDSVSMRNTSETGVKEVSKKGAKPKTPGVQLETLVVPPKKSGSRLSAGSRKSKKVTGEQSTTSSARMRLEAELKAVEEQQRIREEELAAEKELQDLERKLEEELQEKELMIEAKRVAEAKANLKKKMSDEREFRMKQMAIRETIRGRESEADSAGFIIWKK
ncbi:GRB10-interacting GYF protein 2-like [Armigeres subalbatus]|uniref:GRB10-interacting GYF protein 2-like n=1 Tax=Armigeres subalbatus TaxID=124917 RepID=UPI002ED6AA2D